MAVHRVNPVKQWNAQPALQGFGLVTVIDLGPILERVAVLGVRVAAVQERPEVILPDVTGFLEVLLVRLRHLADLFFQGHFGH